MPIRKKGNVEIQTSANGTKTKPTGFTFYSYDKNSAALYFNFREENGEPTDLADATIRLVFVLNDEKITPKTDDIEIWLAVPGAARYIIPESMLGHEGKVTGYVYLEFSDGSHTDEGHFTFEIKRSLITDVIPAMGDKYVQDFEDVKERVEQAEDEAKNGMQDSVNEVNKDYQAWKAEQKQENQDFQNEYKQQWQNFKNTQNKNRTDFESDFKEWKETQENNQTTFENDFSDWKTYQEKKQTNFESDTNATINGINSKVGETQTKVSDLEKNADDLATKQYVDESNETITTQLAQKADEDEVRFRNTAIGINDLDGETLGIIQDGSGGNPIEVLSIPRDKSVTEKKTTFLIHDETSNLIDQSTYLYESYIRGDATGQGKVYSGSGLEATDYIALKPDTDYYFSQIYTGYYAYYDENYDYITGRGFNTDDGGPLPTLNNPFRIPSNAKYGRFTIGDSEDPTKAWIHTENATPPLDKRYQFKDNILISSNNVVNSIEVNGEPTEYAGDDIGIFNNILAVGDSLTAGTFNIRGTDTSYTEYKQYAFPKYLQKMTGVSVKNEGRSGATAKEWYDAMSDTPLTGYDCAIIQLGVNDLFRDSTLEETKTYITNIINKLKTENTGIKIFVSTIIPATSYSNTGYIAISDAIREVVASITSDVYLVDLAAYGHTKDEEAYNNGHLSAYGYWKLAKDYKAYISYLIASNKLAFRNIQFAGTDDTY